MIRALLVAGLFAGSAAGNQADQMCSVIRPLTPLAGVSEASGAALSRRTPGLIWAHSDSGQPILSAFDASGAARGRVLVTGVTVDDWEDIAAGPCPEGSCLYIADIGDNNRARRSITVYRVPEPRADDTATEPAQRWTAAYPYRARDAEALFVMPNEQIFLVSKEAADATALYRLPVGGTGAGARLEMIARLPVGRVTGAAASPDGAWVALRTNSELLFYRGRDIAGGVTAQPRRMNLTAVGEPQGEGVALAADGLVQLVGEGGGRGGTLATLRCMLH